MAESTSVSSFSKNFRFFASKIELENIRGEESYAYSVMNVAFKLTASLKSLWRVHR